MNDLDLTPLLIEWQNGCQQARDRLIRLVYQELCIIARSHLKKERPHHTLNTVGLVNEAYLRICNRSKLKFQNRAHFFGIAARVMRQVLVDYARELSAEKRGGQFERIYLENIDGITDEQAIDIVKLNRALENLAERDIRKCQIVELRYFAGLTIEETALILDTSAATLKREWTFVRAWLLKDLSGMV